MSGFLRRSHHRSPDNALAMTTDAWEVTLRCATTGWTVGRIAFGIIWPAFGNLDGALEMIPDAKVKQSLSAITWRIQILSRGLQTARGIHGSARTTWENA